MALRRWTAQSPHNGNLKRELVNQWLIEWVKKMNCSVSSQWKSEKRMSQPMSQEDELLSQLISKTNKQEQQINSFCPLSLS